MVETTLVRTVREQTEELKKLGLEEYKRRVAVPVLIELPARVGENLEDVPLSGPLGRGTVEAPEDLAPPPRIIKDDAIVHFVRKRPKGAFPDRIGIGRTRTTDIMLAYPRVSKYHAFLRQDGETWVLSDAGSKNGTFVGRIKLAEGEAKPLTDGCEIAIGPYALLFYTPAAFINFLGRR